MFLRILDRLEEILIASLMAAATLVIFLSVVHRYLSTVPVIQDYALKLHVSWAQELCIYMFIWMAKFGAAYGVRKGIHVGVDVLVIRLPPKQRKALIMFGLFGGALFTGIVGTLGANFVWGMAHTDQTSPDLEVPKWIVYLCVPLGSYLMCFRFLQVMWTYFRTGALPHRSHAHIEDVDEPSDAAAPLVDAIEGDAAPRKGNET